MLNPSWDHLGLILGAYGLIWGAYLGPAIPGDWVKIGPS